MVEKFRVGQADAATPLASSLFTPLCHSASPKIQLGGLEVRCN